MGDGKPGHYYPSPIPHCRKKKMLNASLKELSGLLAAKKVSSVELTQTFLKRIAELNPSLNAFITVDAEKSLAQARAADARIAAGKTDMLTGIPFAQKDIFCAQDWLSTCGSKMLANFSAPYDAHVIEQFNRAGAVNLGKTNMDEFAMGSSNETSFFGKVKNPWDVSRVPGGSSGGSAAAVAARLCPAATGTDTGGSIRQPAALVGITGLKPTYGTVSRYGMIAFASSLDQAGPMARSAEDCALMMNVMAGFDSRDSTSLEREKEDYTRDLNQSLKGLKIGLPKEYFAEGLSADVARAVETALAEYRKLGAETVEISLPNTRLSIPVYYVLAPAEASSNLARYDGVRYGYRAPEYGDLTDMYQKSRAQGFGAEVKRRIMIGTYVLSAGYYDAYYIQAQKLRRLIAQDFEAAFKQCDVIMGPTAPTTAFKLGEKSDDPVSMYLSDIYTIAVNLAGLPGMSVPCGFGDNELPVGLQIVGNYFAEARMLNVAHQYQLATDWHTRLPPLHGEE
jgi:aspartyl-tRNA(Asn)/glutamyl-tRNA(Gln) amidotransferase subunit A